ncbi:hypothetical protein JHK85_001102 [Glycine max]|nr:hypothetical protein JHK85_001102 [Glycine max]
MVAAVEKDLFLFGLSSCFSTQKKKKEQSKAEKYNGVCLLTMATTITGMRPPVCNSVGKEHHECIQASGKQLALLFVALYTIAVGGGGIKSNVSVESSKIIISNKFYFFVELWVSHYSLITNQKLISQKIRILYDKEHVIGFHDSNIIQVYSRSFSIFIF